MALFSASMFEEQFDRPVGVVGDPVHASDPVVLQLSDGTSITVFDKLTTALKLAAYMRKNKQWSVSASEDITVLCDCVCPWGQVCWALMLKCRTPQNFGFRSNFGVSSRV